ncbi:beta-n-acetyltransferase [Pseudomassariella vexata]|uniref:Beta-n-acetyltransferase n=1 Tax=Pseudomassariella vexata TaxID=1141098 RepID=A0A1Y2EHT3_9PEZI|nr:beta-n-acetyltransferase [Pseudomassariella vexata]ORY71131.1 beta-n-acetyltransferase [Pseudomassariella vexata]
MPGLNTTSVLHPGTSRPEIGIIRDQQSCLPLTRILDDNDHVLLLTPVVVPFRPEFDKGGDHFEPLGRAISMRHPPVYHVPYNCRNGITETHVPFIRRARVIIFVISGAAAAGQPSQLDAANIARKMGDHCPQVVVACQDAQALGLLEESFPTVLQLPGYSPEHLQAAAAALFGETVPPAVGTASEQNSAKAPIRWDVEELNPMYLNATPIQELWAECLPAQFQLDVFGLRTVLDRKGWARHYAVKGSSTGEMVGFCATFVTFYGNSADQDLVGSLAVLIVKPAYRRRGIGLALHNHAVDELAATDNVVRVQLGSTFPRLFCGVPVDFASAAWFRRRDWKMDGQNPGSGQEVCDWLLRIQDWPSPGEALPDFSFRQSSWQELRTVMEFIGEESKHIEQMGLHDQYSSYLEYESNDGDIILGLHGTVIVATAIIYIPTSGNPSANDLPWSRMIGSDVGGITCICVSSQNPALANSRDSVMIRLLDACISSLRNRGMHRVFLDRVRGGSEGFQQLGFQKWARYHDVWRQS